MKKLDFENGTVIREPVGNNSGYWVGAPGVFYAADEQAWYLTYRIRRPRGVEPDRGGEARIARSTDLKTWQDLWTVNKAAYHSASIERSAIHRGPDKLWRYFTSYVDPVDGRWCVSMLKGADITKLDPAKIQNVFKAAPLGLEGIKDPWIFAHCGIYYMFLSVATPTHKTTDQSHSTLDIYNTGECVSASGLATSRDLDNWEWQGVVFRPEESQSPKEGKVREELVLTPALSSEERENRSPLVGKVQCSQQSWDCYCRRINSIVPQNGMFLAYYDGSASHKDNYEEKTGLAISSDLKTWQSITSDGPAHVSPHASGSLRYIDAQIVDGQTYLFYEYAREDGAHDLRVIKI